MGNRFESGLSFGRAMKPQEPVRPFPYLEREVAFSNSEDGMEIKGTLTCPKTSGKFSAVVLITGSGAHNRDEGILGHKPFLVLSDHLTRAGVAVLRCDDRHLNMPPEKAWSYTTLDFAGDVKAAIDFLKTQPDIDSAFIGVCGHSEGGLVSAIVASIRKDVAFAISLAGPGLGLFEIGKYQAAIFAKDRKSREYAFALIELTRNVPDYRRRHTLAKRLIAKHFKWYEIRKRRTAAKFLPISVSNWQNGMLGLIPSEYWAEVKCPVLAICGEHDRQVPADENLGAIRDALARGGNPDFEIEMIPKANHLFQITAGMHSGDYDSLLKEYASNQETISIRVLERIERFILSRYGKTGRP